MLFLNSLHTEIIPIHGDRYIKQHLPPQGMPRVTTKESVTVTPSPSTTTVTTTEELTMKTAAPTPSPPPPADGSFNSLPIYYKTEPLHSTYSCVGENFREDAWLFRSCSFQNLCFDVTSHSFVLIQSQEDQKFEKLVKESNLSTHISTTGTPTLSLGGINPKWNHNRDRLKWFPRVETEQPANGYYELPADSVWVPFHSFAGYNAGHLFWDDFFPIFKLLQMFDLESPDNTLLLLTKINFKLWGTCDWNPTKGVSCIHAFNKFLPAMGIRNGISTANQTSHDFSFVAGEERKSNYICAPRGAAGLGMLTDHGLKKHGWDEEDWESTHNVGRGHVFYEFRTFMLRNLGIVPPTKPAGPPYSVIFSRYSSNTAGRVRGFQKQEHLLKKAISKSHQLNITGDRWSKHSLHVQAEMASKASIFVTVVGGGAMTATFLPRGATLILFYEATGGRRRDRNTGKPAMLDWDVLNHASHLRVHWLPIETSETPEGLQIFLELVKHELQIIKQLHV